MNTKAFNLYQREMNNLQQDLANLKWARDFVKNDESGCVIAMKYFSKTNPTKIDNEAQLLAHQKEAYAMVRGRDGKVTCQVVHDHVRVSNPDEMKRLQQIGYMPVGIIENVYADVLGFTQSDDHLDEHGIRDFCPERYYSPLRYISENEKDKAVADWFSKPVNISLEDSKEDMKEYLSKHLSRAKRELFSAQLKLLTMNQPQPSVAEDYLRQLDVSALRTGKNNDKTIATIDPKMVDKWCYAQKPLEKTNLSYSKISVLGLN